MKIKTEQSEHGGALIMVMWMTAGLASMALLASSSASFNLRRMNALIETEFARNTLRAAELYAHEVISKAGTGKRPEFDTEETENSADDVDFQGNHFWYLGHTVIESDAEDEIPFYLQDEAAKLNINTVSESMLINLPGMTSEIAASIVDWRDEDEEPLEGGAETQTYNLASPSYDAKNDRFESIFELRLINGMTPDLLFGRDKNFNGLIEPYEEELEFEGEDFGFLHYLTCWSKEPKGEDGENGKLNINDSDTSKLQKLFQEEFGNQKAVELIVLLTRGPNRGKYGSILQFYLVSGLKGEEFKKIEDKITAYDKEKEGLINVNSASKEVLMCLPGIDEQTADTMIAFRQQNSEAIKSIVWLQNAIGAEKALQMSEYATVASYQFMADVVAVTQSTRCYKRNILIIDFSGESPKTTYRRDVTELGWSLGDDIREQLQEEKMEYEEKD